MGPPGPPGDALMYFADMKWGQYEQVILVEDIICGGTVSQLVAWLTSYFVERDPPGPGPLPNYAAESNSVTLVTYLEDHWATSKFLWLLSTYFRKKAGVTITQYNGTEADYIGDLCTLLQAQSWASPLLRILDRFFEPAVGAPVKTEYHYGVTGWSG